MEKIVKTEEQWRQELDPAAYEVLRHQATERPWAGKYVNEKGDGVYRCAGCGNALFNS
jgi:peptide-methionine (R)-S-oxide reductase